MICVYLTYNIPKKSPNIDTFLPSVQDIYRTGVLHLNTDMCALVLQKDLEYWQIDELILGKSQFRAVETIDHRYICFSPFCCQKRTSMSERATYVLA